MAQNRLVQSTLYQECSRLLPKPNSPIDKDVLREAQYAKAVLKESLRLRPVSVGIGRVVDRDTEFSGYNVPKGVCIIELFKHNYKICILF